MSKPLMAAVLLLALAAPAPAAGAEHGLGVALGAGYDATAMGDVNQGRANAVQGGPALGLGLRWRALDWLGLGLDGSYLMPNVRDEPHRFPFTMTDGSPVDYSIQERYDALEALAQAWWIRPWGPLDLRLGGGGGWAWLSGASIDSTAPGGQRSLLYGSAPSWRAGAGLDWWLDRHFCAGLDLGWRWCRIAEVEQAGAASGRLSLPDGSALSVDFSGFSARLGGAFWF